MNFRTMLRPFAIAAGVVLLGSLVSGCDEKKPVPIVDPATNRTVPPALHDFEGDRKTEPGQAATEKPTGGRRMPALHDFEADRKKAQK